VAIAACSQAQTFTLDKLQFVFGVVALVVGGAEAIQRQEWVLFALGVLGAGIGLVSSLGGPAGVGIRSRWLWAIAFHPLGIPGLVCPGGVGSGLCVER